MLYDAECMQSNGETRFYMFLQSSPAADELNSYSVLLSEVTESLSLRLRGCCQSVGNFRNVKLWFTCFWLRHPIGNSIFVSIAGYGYEHLSVVQLSLSGLLSCCCCCCRTIDSSHLFSKYQLECVYSFR